MGTGKGIDSFTIFWIQKLILISLVVRLTKFVNLVIFLFVLYDDLLICIQYLASAYYRLIFDFYSTALCLEYGLIEVFGYYYLSSIAP